MQGWLRNGALWLALSSALACLGTACGAAYETTPNPRPSDGGDSAGGALAAGKAGAGEAGEGGDAAGAAGQSAEPIPLDQVARPMLEAQCERLTRCGQAIQYEQAPGGCVGAQLADWQAAFDALKDEIAQGSVVYDPAAAMACIAARRTAHCDGSVFPDECEAAIDGTRVAGEACARDVECVGDLFCEGCPGKCTRRARLGEACSDGHWCRAGLECNDERCVALRFEGESCDYEGARCAAGDVCLNWAAETDGVCRPLHAAKLGEECGWGLGLFCEPNRACVGTAQTETGTRETCVKRSRSGGTCWRGFQDSCPEGEYCPLSLSDQAEGQLTAKCRPLAQAGQRCLDYKSCAPSSRCLFGDLCVAPRALGEGCNEADECSSWACVQGVCAIADSCASAGASAGDRGDVPVLHDPPRPAERCPTQASAGELVQGFDNSASIAGWAAHGNGQGVVDWNMAERFSCSGALHLHASFSAAGQYLYAMVPSPTDTVWDWSQRKRLHLWVRLGAPGVGDLEQLLRVTAVVSSRSADLQNNEMSFGNSADASWLRDFAWHELVVDLNEPDPQRVDGYGIHLYVSDVLPDGAPKELPEIDLYVDDVWLE